MESQKQFNDKYFCNLNGRKVSKMEKTFIDFFIIVDLMRLELDVMTAGVSSVTGFFYWQLTFDTWSRGCGFSFIFHCFISHLIGCKTINIPEMFQCSLFYEKDCNYGANKGVAKDFCLFNTTDWTTSKKC